MNRKTRLIPFFLALAIVFSFATVTYAKTAAETTMIFIEAESCALNGYTAQDKTGAVGKAITAETAEDDAFTVKFTVPKDGDYVIWLRIWNESQSDNSIFYDYNDETHVFDFDEAPGENDPSFLQYNKWYWRAINFRGTEPLEKGLSEWAEANSSVRHSPQILKLKAGENSMEFRCREPGHFIDQIIITDDLKYDPSAFEGNTTYTCGFCNLEHYVSEPLVALGKSPQQLWEEKLAAELAPAESSSAESSEKTSPRTSDNPINIMVFLSAASILIIGLKKKIRG